MRVVSLLTLLTLTTLAAACSEYAAASSEPREDLTLILTPQRDADGQIVPIEKSPEQWKAELSDVEYHILREHGTERAFTGRYHDSKEDGVYACAATGLVLFDSKTKFDSGTGWPSFYAPIHEDHVTLHRDTKFGMVRTEVRCALCDGHLGHVFDDGPPPTGKRYCINGYALKFFDRATYEAALAAADATAEAG